MNLIYKLLDKNIFIDPKPIPNKNNMYAVYVSKNRLNEVKKNFQEINKKVSDKSAYKSLICNLGEDKSWNEGKPKSCSFFSKDSKKFFCELDIDNIVNLRHILEAYKNKEFRNWKLIFGGESEGKEVKNFSEVKQLIKNKLKKAVNKIRKKEQGPLSTSEKSHEKQAVELIREAETQYAQVIKDKYAKMLNEDLKKFDDRVNSQIKELIDKVNSMSPIVKLVYSQKCTYSSLKKNHEEIIGQIENFINSNKANDSVVKVLNDWVQSVGAELFSRDKSLKILDEYTKEGYNIISILGSGGAAMVVKFIDNKGKEKALKIFNSKESFSSYQEEKSAIEKMGSVNKKKLKKYFNAPKIDEKGNMKMKLAKKVLDSDEFINDGNKSSDLNMNFFKKMARQVLKGLESMHSQNLIHGDIKPDNIHMVANKKIGKSDRFKIADLGTVYDASEKSFGGTPIYTHQDMTRNSTSEQRMKNDVYALGCSLLDILMGKRVVGKAFGGHVSFLESNTDEQIYNQISSKYRNMDTNSIESVLNFIRRLCKERLNDVPTAKEALKDKFLKK